MPKRLLVVSDHSNSRVERSRSQVPTPNPSILSLKCSLPTASVDDDRVMLVTLKAFTSMYPASRRQPEPACTGPGDPTPDCGRESAVIPTPGARRAISPNAPFAEFPWAQVPAHLAAMFPGCLALFRGVKTLIYLIPPFD